jgi:hypothetical protein
MEKFPKETIIKGTEFWKQEIEQIGLLDKLPFFNDVITETRPPHIDAGYGEPLLINITLDGKNVDVYHTDWNGGSWHRVFIHLKDKDNF